MNVERIIINNNGIGAMIFMLNADGETIREITERCDKYLIDKDCNIDYKTIAILCGMTTKELKRHYKLVEIESQSNSDWVLSSLDFDYDFDDEDYNDTDDECFISDGLAYDRAHGYRLESLVRDNMGQIDHIDYASLDDGSIVTIPKEDLYIDGVELLDYYGDCDYAFKSRLNSLIIMYQDGFEEAYENFKAELDKFAKGLKQVGTKTKAVKAEPEETVIEVPKEEPVVTNNNLVVAKLQELMVKALEEGDFDAYDKLEERLNRIIG